MVGIVIVSHSNKIAQGIVELARQISEPKLAIVAAGGMRNGSIGTDAVMVSEAIEKANTGNGAVILAEFGSAILSAGMAMELIDSNLRDTTKIADAPIVEGAIGAAISASVGDSLDDVVAAAEEARNMSKL
jgi:dihydroxyacetone kinase, phosphotransfer subunit